MKVGLFFGSFNPIHIGHLALAENVLNETDCKQVWLIVSPQNPFKSEKTLLNAAERLHLCELATSDNPRIRPNNIEFFMPKPSYTADTLLRLRERYPSYEFCICMGQDSVLSLPKWKRYEEILSYTIILFSRPGCEPTSFTPPKLAYIPAPLLDISASRIRELLAQGKSVKYLTPDACLEYIQSKHLYGV